MNLKLLCIVVLSIITTTECALREKYTYKTGSLYIVTEGNLKDQDVTIIISAQEKWETDNIWGNIRARNHSAVQSFFVSMLQEVYPFNRSAQQELVVCYNEAPDVHPLLATTKYDSEEYFLVRYCYNKKNKAYQEHLVPKEWLQQKK